MHIPYTDAPDTQVQHSILSSTVIAKDCASADAYATAFMVMGLDSAKAFCEAHPELDAYFICSGEGDKYETYFTNGMKKFIASENRHQRGASKHRQTIIQMESYQNSPQININLTQSSWFPIKYLW